MADSFIAANQEAMPHESARAWCTRWLEAKKVELEDTSFVRYKYVVEPFLTFLGARAEKDVAAVRVADVGGFRDRQAKELSRNTANVSVKVLRACFSAAVKQGLITSNPASAVDRLKQRGKSKRRPFTMAEIRRVLQACGDSEWRGMVLFGCYTGQRLSDLAGLTWRAADLQNATVSFTTGKTGRRMVLPLAKPLQDYLTNLPSVDNPDAAIFPTAATKRTSQLSDGFRQVLVEAGLASARTHKKTEDSKGRNAARPVAELSFHSLRHTATTFFKAAGASNALAGEFIGHETEAMNRQYTHLSTEDLRAAVDKLPDITKGAN